MKAPESLETLVDYGIIQEVVRPLMSGKEAQVYIVIAQGEECVAKVYKEAIQRTFKHRSEYTEGRRTRNTRDQRAISKRTRHGRKQDEDAWRNTEADMIYRLREAGVRVPEPINFVDGVLVMELVKDAEGNPAPRLGDLDFSADEAYGIYQNLLREVVRMLCAGVIHGDLSDFNVLMGVDGPVLIDFPQSVDPAQNQNARRLLLRDVENLHRFHARFSLDRPIQPYGEEIWSLFQANRLEPSTKLSGHYAAPKAKANTDEVLTLIEDARREEQFRRGIRRPDDAEEAQAAEKGETKAPKPFRVVVDMAQDAHPQRNTKKRGGEAKGSRPQRRRRRSGSASATPTASSVASSAGSGTKSSAAPAGQRGRRRRKSGTVGGGAAPTLTSQYEIATAGPAEPNGSPSGQRRGRGRGRPKARSAEAGAREDTKQSSKPATGSGVGAASKGVGANRPARRRRRRPRAASSSK